MTASWSGSLADPAEYKVAARGIARNGGLLSVRCRCSDSPDLSSPISHCRRVDWECSASRRALARARFAAYGLDPSAFPVTVAHRGSAHCADPRPKKEHTPPTSRLDTEDPIQGFSDACRSSLWHHPAAAGIREPLTFPDL